MGQIEIFVALLSIIVIVGILFKKTSVPIPLLLVVAGMLVSFLPHISYPELKPNLVLNLFLPLLVYTTSAESSWRDVKLNIRPIALMSIGHVVFITVLVALVVHTLIPQLGWALALVLGAIVSPPDDVAIIPIAEKIHIPRRIVTILKGEALLNDATALILFRFALAAVITHQFSATHAISSFAFVVVGETLYGLALGYVMGELRLRISDPMLQVMISILTPFLAYLPAEKLGGCGVLATVVTGMVIGHKYLERLAPDARLLARAVWSTVSFAAQSILFLLVGLDLRFILGRISSIPLEQLALYSMAVILTVIIGRFIWVFPAAYLPRFLFPSIRKKDPYPPWQHPFIISWAGMRGGVSLAAALAVPALAMTVSGVNPKDLLLFLVFCVIIATLLLQGLTLPWILKILGVHVHGQCEEYHEHLAELSARLKMIRAVLRWLLDYKQLVKSDPKSCEEIHLQIAKYRMLKTQLKERIKNHDGSLAHDEASELQETIFLSAQIIEVERKELTRLWREETITHTVRKKLLQQLDLRDKKLMG